MAAPEYDLETGSMANRGLGKLRLVVMAGLAGVSWLLPMAPALGQEPPPSLRGPKTVPSPPEQNTPVAAPPQIQLLISARQQFLAEPEAARIVLHIHNPTPQTTWLYRRAKGKHPLEDRPREEDQSVETTGGSTVEVRLQPADAKAAQGVITPAEATTLEYVQMPKPRLAKLAAGGDYEEVSIVHLRPALAERQKPVWGAYKLTVVYGASFSNGDQFQRNLGTPLWQGEVTSNTITVELRPPLPDSKGVLAGSALGKDLQPRAGVRVSLSDEHGQLIDQQVTGGHGRFSFANLPLTTYWVAGRREDAKEDTLIYHHEELTSAAPSVNSQLVFFPVEIYEAKKLVHKPVLLRVFDADHKPLGGIDIDVIFSNGDILEDVKATSGDDGMAALELLPGRSSISLNRHGCAEQVERVDVDPGVGVDSSKFTFTCEKK